MSYARFILIEDTDGGYVKAEYQTDKENPDEESIPVYKQVDYFHDLESALRETGSGK